MLDPFAGVGTTLIEAVLAGHSAIGFELNPYAAFACQTKLNAFRLSPDDLARAIEQLQCFFLRASENGRVPISRPPVGFKTRGPFYSPKVLRKVLLANDFIASVTDDLLRNVFRLAFASTMVSYSNYSYEPSLGRRASAGKKDIEDFDVGTAIATKLLEVAHDIRWLRQQLAGRTPRSQVFNDSFFRCREHVQRDSVGLVVTSPPYLNNYHYNRNTRPHLYWLDFVQSPAHLRPLEEENFGKYWQTVRELDRVDLEFESTDGEIASALALLREKRGDKGIYGGNGWANYAAAYFNDCYRFARELKRVLKRRAKALVVIGNSILQGQMIPTDQYFAKIAGSLGLDVVGISIPRDARVGNSIIKSEVRATKAAGSHRLYEAVVELRKR